MTAMATEQDVRIDAGVFAPFRPWSGWVPEGYWANWLGVRTSAKVWAFSPQDLEVFSRGRHETTGYPYHDEHVLDFSPLLEAVLGAQGRFVMIALGAGWGRWLTAGAAAARQRGLGYHLVGVEAEPDHFRWLKEHLEENGVRPAECRLFNAAASAHTGACWFYVGKPDSWYGQKIVPDSAVPRKWWWWVPVGKEVEHQGERLRRIRSVNARDVLSAAGGVVDYLHMDIQGTELDFLAAGAELIQQRVRRVNIGTHSAEIEAGLRRLFGQLGWINRHDVPMNGLLPVFVGDQQVSTVQFGDGVQVWVNPRLVQAAAKPAA
jgi:FkbM family methyltransferase